MKKVVIVIAILCSLLILCLPIISYATSEPVLASVLGAIAGSSTSSWYNLNISSFTPGNFSLRATNDYTAVTDIRLYFQVSAPYNSFEIIIIGKNSMQSISDGAFSKPVYTSDYQNGAFTNTTSIQSSVQSSKYTNSDGYPVYKYQYSGTSINKNALMVTLPYSITVMGNGVFYDFEIQTFALNGINVDEVAINNANNSLASDISSLSANEDEWWQLVILPGYEDYIDSTDINAALSDYKLVIKEVSFNNFLVPALITLVFTFAFYGFVLFGKKG